VSEDRNQLVRDAFARWNDGERELNPETAHPNLVIHSFLTGADYRGADGFRKWAAEIDEQFERWAVAIETIHDAPDGRVVVFGGIRFTVAAAASRASRRPAGSFASRGTW
jgi:ketosteroid isomerase-like protein